jgi:hypothetical protein
MYAVLIEVDVAGVDRESGIRALREQIVPTIRQLPGFQSGNWLTGGAEGKGLSLAVWDTEGHAQTMADRLLARVRPRARRSPGARCGRWRRPREQASVT